MSKVLSISSPREANANFTDIAKFINAFERPPGTLSSFCIPVNVASMNFSIVTPISLKASAFDVPKASFRIVASLGIFSIMLRKS